MPKVQIGDVVLNPKEHGTTCVISAIQSSYFVLQPFTRRGWPSRDRRKWQYHRIDIINTLKPHIKQGAFRKLIACPECQKSGKSLFQAPLRKQSVYEDVYQCQRCKQKFQESELK